MGEYSLNTMTPSPLLRRRISIATTVVIPTKPLHAIATATTSSYSLPSIPIPAVDFELISIKPLSYTSLKDLLPSTDSVESPTAYDISIRNRLVKQAAWAYLQPLSTSPDSVGLHCLRRLWDRLSGDAFLQFIDRRILRTITGVFDRLLRLIRVRS